MPQEREALPDKIAIDMTPMIDVVFQLITFFMLTLKDVSVEGDFGVKMPLGISRAAVEEDPVPPLIIKMRSDADGRLASITINETPVVGQEVLDALATADGMMDSAQGMKEGEAKKKAVEAATKRMRSAAKQVVDSLRTKVIDIVGTGPGSNADKTEVELDCDYALEYEHVIRAITAVSGDVKPDGEVVELIKKIKFSPPKKPR